jgi:hypothetical protein
MIIDGLCWEAVCGRYMIGPKVVLQDVGGVFHLGGWCVDVPTKRTEQKNFERLVANRAFEVKRMRELRAILETYFPACRVSFKALPVSCLRLFV